MQNLKKKNGLNNEKPIRIHYINSLILHSSHEKNIEVDLSWLLLKKTVPFFFFIYIELIL